MTTEGPLSGDAEHVASARPLDHTADTALARGTPAGHDAVAETLDARVDAGTADGGGDSVAGAIAGVASWLGPGARIAQFEVIRELGRGGMGQVSLARDTRLGRLVALKFLSLRSPELVDRFLVEARATARCTHENIVVIYEAAEWHGQPYMALEYLEGEPMSRLLDGRPLPVRRALDLIVPVVRALVRAHELGIVHRDLKPDNVFVTRTGQVKVLDFGIAKLFPGDVGPRDVGAATAGSLTQHGMLVGSLPYMAPEQWAGGDVDRRADLWAVGLLLWEMLAGRHPLAPTSRGALERAARALDEPMPSIATARPDLPSELERVVDRCLAKRADRRFDSARELAAVLETLVPGRHGRRLDEDECPYPGLRAFQESDADRFFGRDRDVEHALRRLDEQPLLAVVGPSGVGKSSFVRAGVVPALRGRDESWEVVMTRPGRSPLSALATLLQTITQGGVQGAPGANDSLDVLVDRLRAEPGTLGTLLRARATHKGSRILLFVDQFEELFTLGDDDDERRACAACLAGVADDPSSPLRVVVAMRSDFLDRASEHRALFDRLSRSLLFLPPVDRAGILEALTHPLDMVGHHFESDAIVDDMLATLASTDGALPLLQFTAAALWETRDRARRLLTASSYASLGGVAGALASHADEVVRTLSPHQQRLVRAVFARLVTADGTRALADLGELRELSSEPGEVQALIDHLVAARLLVVQRRGDLPEAQASIELVHESLITRWPTLRRWREESAEDSAFVEELRAAARQWDSRGRPPGLLWRGEVAEDAARFQRRFRGDLSGRERAFLDEVLAQASRAARTRRRALGAVFAVLLAVLAAAAVALVSIRSAEQGARAAQHRAETEAARARSAESKVSEQLATITDQIRTIERKETERERAAHEAETASREAAEGEHKLALTYEQLAAALDQSRKERARAEAATRETAKLADAERAARENAEQLLARERARVKELEDQRKKLSTQLK